MPDPSLTALLQRFSAGERDIAEAVLREILPKLHEIAVRELRKERYIAPLDPTELINEVWLRSLGNGGWQISDRYHFYAIAALAMRRVLVDFARSRLAQRRGNGEAPLPLNEIAYRVQALNSDPETLVHMGMLIEELSARNPEIARIVDLHYIVGFTFEEIAENAGLTLRQVRHRWGKGRDWLKDRL